MWLEKIFSQLRGWPKKIRYRPNAFCFRITNTPRIFHLLTRMITAKEDNRSNIRIPWVLGYQRFFFSLAAVRNFFSLIVCLTLGIIPIGPANILCIVPNAIYSFYTLYFSTFHLDNGVTLRQNVVHFFKCFSNIF